MSGGTQLGAPGNGRAPRVARPDDALWIVNPVAGYGRGGSVQERIRRELPGAQVHRTACPWDAYEAARAAVRAGRRTIVAVGGDGTLSEVANGVLDEDATGDVAVAFVPAGTLSDFARGRSVSETLVGALDRRRAQLVDVGRVACQGPDGPLERWFVVNCTVGLVSAIGQRFVEKPPLNLAIKRVSVRLAEAVYAADTALRWRPVRMTVRTDAGEWHAPATNLAVLKVPYFAGGMSFGSDLAPDDGSLDAVLVDGVGRAGLARVLWKAFRNELRGHPAIRSARTRGVEVETERPLPVEVDGDIVGRTPATFSVEPRRLLTIT
jgi:diacylglycerol kinase (ATP)